MTQGGLAPGTVLQGTYRIVRRIGEGGMGQVYEASHARLSGRYAVKLLLREVAASPEAYARFRREAEITSSLRHPNIVQVIDFNETPDGTPYLVMEFLEGHDLAARLREAGTISVRQVAGIVEQVAAALSAAHKRGITHRDLKPQNIVILPVEGKTEEAVKVLDFGVSKVRAASQNLTRSQSLLGTPQYMAPEQALGESELVDARSDVFALAAITFEMLTGRPPFRGDNLPAVLYQVVHENPPLCTALAPWVPEQVSAVIAGGLAKSRDARPPSAVEFARALLAAVGAAGASIDDTQVTPPPAPKSVEATVPRAVVPPAKHLPPITTFTRATGELTNPLAPTPTQARRRVRRHLVLAVGLGAAAAAGFGLWVLGPGTSRPTRPGISTGSAPTGPPPAPPPARPPVVETMAPVVETMTPPPVPPVMPEPVQEAMPRNNDARPAPVLPDAKVPAPRHRTKKAAASAEPVLPWDVADGKREPSPSPVPSPAPSPVKKRGKFVTDL